MFIDLNFTFFFILLQNNTISMSQENLASKLNVLEKQPLQLHRQKSPIVKWDDKDQIILQLRNELEILKKSKCLDEQKKVIDIPGQQSTYTSKSKILTNINC